MIGRPVEYLTQTLNQLMEVISLEPDIKIVEKKVHEPKKIEDAKMKDDMFSTFAEVGIKAGMDKMFYIISKYMPSHIEIVAPESFKMTNNDLGSLLTEFARRLHRYDEIAKGALIKNQILENQLRKFQPVVPASSPLIQIPAKDEKSKGKKVSQKARAKKRV